MRTVIVSVIGISSLFLVVMVQRNITARIWEREEMEEALSAAMEQTLSEVVEKNSYGMQNRNEMIAAFLQAMLRRIQEDVDLTVKIHQFDFVLGQMDVEVMGEIRKKGKKTRRIRLRRKLIFQT